jgi:putative N-acetylmannosamine-6-phosphate epimerase
MGDIAPSKMPNGTKKARRDSTDFTQYKEGGKVKSKVNASGNYTKPDLRKRIFNSVKAAAIVGTGAGQWSARKAQVMAKRYKAAGGGYRD